MQDDRYEAWEARKLYLECRNCHYACTLGRDEADRGERRRCPACGGSDTLGEARYWMRPPGFAHPVSREEGTSPDDQPARSYATRAKLSAPTPIDQEDWTRLNERLRTHSMRKHLLVTNRGPREEGYTYCTQCGLIEPTSAPQGSVAGAHQKPYPDDRDDTCPGSYVTKGLVLGSDFITDVLLVSLRVDPPATIEPGLLSTDVALRTSAEALTKAACDLLELEPGELNGEYRPSLTSAGASGAEAEIYLYDTLSGGAGFARTAKDLGLRMFERALRILEECPERCDASCYRCLRSYKNKFEHELLDRHLGAGLLRHLLDGQAITLDPDRIRRTTDLLFEDLSRQRSAGLEFTRDQRLHVDGIGDIRAPIVASQSGKGNLVIALHGPLTPNEPASKELKEMQEFAISTLLLLCDELVVRRNLPSVTGDLIRRLS